MERAIQLVVAIVVLLAVVAGQVQGAIVFSQDFESGLGPGESVAGAFVINTTGYGNNGTRMMGHASTYGDSEYSYYQIAGLNLTGFTNVQLSFDYRGSFETHFDRFNVQASSLPISPPGDLLMPTFASNMQYISDHVHQGNLGATYYDTSASTGGQSGVARFDLSAFAGSIVNLRFQFGTDESVVAAGFNMDNLLIEGEGVPEPSSLILLGFGAVGVVFVVARRRKKLPV